MLFPWHVPEWSLSYCNPDEWWLQTWLYLTYDWMLDIHMGVACFLNFWEMCDWGVTKPMATMSDSLGSIWVMDVFLIYKWWCVWHPPELWVNPSGPYKWSLNADYQSERWLWFLASMSVGSYLGIKLNDGCHWHLTECCFLDTQLLQSRWVITTNLAIFDLWLKAWHPYGCGLFP